MLPYLNSTDPVTRNTAEAFMSCEAQVAPGIPFNVYSAYIVAHKSDPPLPLIERMYRCSPGNALTAMEGVYSLPARARGRKLKWATHEVDDYVWRRRNGFPDDKATASARAELTSLSDWKQWWVRLYVAKTMRENPELVVPEVMAQLAGDESPLGPPCGDRRLGPADPVGPVPCRAEVAVTVTFTPHPPSPGVSGKGAGALAPLRSLRFALGGAHVPPDEPALRNSPIPRPPHLTPRRVMK